MRRESQVLVVLMWLFWIVLLYGGGRKMSEQVGLHVGSVAGGLVMASLYSLPIALTILLAAGQSKFANVREWGRTFPVGSLLLGALIVCAATESWLLLDELRFRQLVAEAPDRPVARDRNWPAHGGTLIYRPDLGVVATD